jgi:hypothetical protein
VEVQALCRWDYVLTIEIDTVFPDYDSLTVETVYGCNFTGLHIHYQLYLSDSAMFNGETVAVVSVRYNECNGYLPDGFDLIHNGDTVGKRNGFYDAVDGYFYEIPSGGLTNGHRSYKEPNVTLTVEPDSLSASGAADSGYVGESVAAPVFIQDCNFYYADGYDFTLKFDSMLSYDYTDTTIYSSNPDIDIVDDTTVRFHIDSNFSGTAPIDASGQDTFIVVHFNIDTTAEADTAYNYWIDGEYTFTGCEYYSYTAGCCGERGDVDHDGSVNIVDVTYLVAFLFHGGPLPPCMEEADIDGISGINVADLTYFVDYLFYFGSAPPDC